MSDAAPPLIDAHHHVWDVARHPQDWLDEPVYAPIRRTFTLADLHAAATRTIAGRRLTTSVVVQCVTSRQETEELLAMAAVQPRVGAVVGWADLSDPAIGAVVDRLRAGPGGSLLRSLRHLVQGETDPAYLDRPDVRRGIAAVGAAGLVFDLLVRQHQLPMATRLARDLPEVRFVLDHLGKPALGRPELADWARDLRALATSPNTTAKLSGLVTEVPRSQWTPEDLRPAVDDALDAFGPDRLMFGSDWPVCLLASSYRRWVEVLAESLGDLGAAERALIWEHTARRVYRLGAS